MLIYLASSTRPNIQYEAYQISRFCNDPKERHTKVMKRISRYLKCIKDKVIIFEPNKLLGFKD